MTMNWPPPKEEYLKSLFKLALANKKLQPYMHRRARGTNPLCEQVADLEQQTLQDHEVTCPVCQARIAEFK
jgi:hypothetical protein